MSTDEETQRFRRARDLREAATAAPGEILARGLREDVGDAMRLWRKDKGMSLRAAAAELDVPFSYLQKLETGGRAKQPPIQLFQRMAVVYAVPVGEVFAAAGYNLRIIEEPRDSIDRIFRELVMRPEFRPKGMTPAWLDSFSTKQKLQWLEFAYRMQSYIDDETNDFLPISHDVRSLYSDTSQEDDR